MTTITADDQLVWDTPTGTVLLCVEAVVMTDDHEVAFTKGNRYVVKSMHPIAEPAYVRLINDHGQNHKMCGEHLRRFFARPR